MGYTGEKYITFSYCCLYTGTTIGLCRGLMKIRDRYFFRDLFDNVLTSTLDGFITGLIWPIGVPLFLLSLFEKSIEDKKEIIDVNDSDSDSASDSI